MFLYNALLRGRYELSVRSVVFLLRPEAQGPGATGRVLDPFEGAEQDHGLDFRYRLVRVWEYPLEAVLAGGLGTLPLAPISAVEPARLPEVVERMKDRLDREAPREEVGDLWAATLVLMGLRYPRPVAEQLLKGVRHMEESVTYQAILEKGVEKGIEKGKLLGQAEEARALLVRFGRRRLGDPDAATRSALQAIADVQRLEALCDRVQDVSSWEDLLRTSG